MNGGPIPYVNRIVEAMIQARAAIPVIVETVAWLRDLLKRSGEPVPSTVELADMIDQIAAQNADFNREEIDRLQAKLVEGES